MQGLDVRSKICLSCKSLTRYGTGGNMSCLVCPKNTLVNANGTGCLPGCAA